MGRLYTDDDIHRFQGRWVSARGSVLPFQARYVAWGLFLAVFVVFCPVLLLLGASPVWAVVYGGALSVLAVVAISDKITPERPVRAWISMLAGEWRTYRQRRRDRPGRAVSVTTRRVRGLR